MDRVFSGEWFGSGIQRRYGLTEKRFWLFNTGRWSEGFPEGLPSNIGIVPVLYQGDFDTHKIDEIMADLKTNGSKAVPGWMQPEGIVIFHCQSRQLYKYTFDGDGKEPTKPKQRGKLDLPPVQAYNPGQAPL